MIDLNHSRNLAVRPRAGCFQVLFRLPVLIAGLGLMMLSGRVLAQTVVSPGACGLSKYEDKMI